MKIVTYFKFKTFFFGRYWHTFGLLIVAYMANMEAVF